MAKSNKMKITDSILCSTDSSSESDYIIDFKNSSFKRNEPCNEISNIAKRLKSSNLEWNGNAVIYTRVSSQRQTEGTSLNSQLQFCQDYCKQHNFKIVNSFEDVGSARIMSKQKSLSKFMEDDNKDINFIVFDPSRLTRSVEDGSRFLNYCSARNITIHFVNDNLVSSNSLDIKKILSKFVDSEVESNMISTRVKASITFRKRNKTYAPSLAPFGFRYIKTDMGRKLVEIEEEQKIIKVIVGLYYGSEAKPIEKLLTEITGTKQELCLINDDSSVEIIEKGNMSKKSVAEFLNTLAITKRGNKWSSASVSFITDRYLEKETPLSIEPILRTESSDSELEDF